MMVKICGITNLEDALAAVEEGASALGFNFYPRSPRYVAPELAGRIIAALPAAVWKVGVFVDDAGAAELAHRIGLDVVQLHGDEPPAAVPADLRAWKAFHVDAAFDPRRMAEYTVEAFLLDAPAGAAHGGSGQTFDWSAAAGLGGKIILAGGLDASNVRQAIESARPWGVDACSRLESSPGRKDHAKMKQFLKAALS